MSNPLISDNETTLHRQAASAGKDEGPPPVDVNLLADYAEFEAWKRAREADAAESPAALAAPTVLELSLPPARPGADPVVKKYRLAPLDRDVIVHLQVLVTFSDTDQDKAIALFDALLEPDEFDRLQKDLRPALRQIRRARAADPNAPSIEDTWVAMAQAVAEPLQALVADPKAAASLIGPSPTGGGSKPSSVPSALPSMT